MELIPLIASLSGLFIAGITAGIQIVIKFNDLAHLDKKITDIGTKLNTMDLKLDNNAERISKIEGKCAATHG